MYIKVTTINGISVHISDLFSPRKIKAIKEILHVQLNGMSQDNSGENAPQNIFLEPYLYEVEDEDEVVPGAYIFRQKQSKLFAIEKKISISISSFNVNFGFDSIFGFSIHFLYYLTLLLSGKTLVHAAAFQTQTKCVIVPAFGGIGKTFLVTKLSESEEIKIFGDDLIILNDQNSISPYLRPMCIYKYHYDKYLKKRLPIKLHYLKPSILWRLFLRIRYEILNRFGLRLGSVDNFSHSNGYVVMPANFILKKNQIPSNEVLLTTVLLIKRKNIKSIVVTKIQSDQKLSLAKYTSDVLRHEWSDYSKLMSAYSAFSGGFANELFSISDKVILNMFAKTEDIYEMLIPMNCNDNDIEFAVRSVL